MVVLVTCKIKEDPVKNLGARVFTSLYINFSDVQGQITLELVVVSGRNLNSSKLLCMSLLPASMRMIESKMKELECSQDFSHYKSMGIFLDAQGQLTPQSLVRSGRISNSSEKLWMLSLPASTKKIRSKMRALECSQHFPHYIPMGAIGCHGGSQSIRTQVNSYSSQFVLILVNSYSKFWSTRTHLVNSYSCLVSSYSIWSIRTHFGQFVLKLK